MTAGAPACTTPNWRRRTDWVLGGERRVRVRVAFQLLAWAVYLGCDIALLVGMAAGVVAPATGTLLIGVTLAAQAAFYLLLRSGWSERLRDPSLMLAQSVVALTLVAWGYAIAGPLRDCTLMLAVMVIVYAMFCLSPRQTLGLGLYAVAVLGAAMGLLSALQPQAYPPQTELLRFALVAAALPVTTSLACYVSQLGQRLQQQQQALRDALAQAQQLATRDALTGLVNRRHMHELLGLALRHEQYRGLAFCLALVDVDQLKAINDTHGDAVGDAVLRGLSQLALRTLRHSDVIARWGSDELLILQTETRAEHATRALQRLRHELASLALVPERPELRVSFSAGLAAHVPGETVEQTLERVEHALAQAQASGPAHAPGRGGLQAQQHTPKCAFAAAARALHRDALAAV